LAIEADDLGRLFLKGLTDGPAQGATPPRDKDPSPFEQKLHLPKGDRPWTRS